MSTSRTGADLFCATLEHLGVAHVFGVPGTRNAELFESLRRSRMETVLPTHEMAGAFMANGYALATGRPGVLITISGPGFTYALTGLAEARLDSNPLLHITGAPPSPGGPFSHQWLPQGRIADGVAKEVIDIADVSELQQGLTRAFYLTMEGEPGPVVVQVANEIWSASVAGSDEPVGGPSANEGPDDNEADEAFERAVGALLGADRPVFFLGGGAQAVHLEITEMVERLGIPVFSTPSGRGIYAEDRSWSLGYDAVKGGTAALNAMLGGADLVVALGAKLGHNGTASFGIEIPQERLIHVNQDPSAFEGPYDAAIQVAMSCERFVSRIQPRAEGKGPTQWMPEEVAHVREQLTSHASAAEPVLVGSGRPVGELVVSLQQRLAPDAILVTDSGLHQFTVRRRGQFRSPRSLMMPSDLQSMGFGLPAAIGAKLAAPDRQVVAIIGDGGLGMSGMELATLSRLRLDLPVLVFNDGFLNLIRITQLRDSGKGHGVELHGPDLVKLADAFGISSVRVGEDLEGSIDRALSMNGPVLVDVPLEDSPAMRSGARRSRVKAAARNFLGPELVNRIKGTLGGGDAE